MKSRTYGILNTPEDKACCVECVPTAGSVTFRQCSRKRGYGPGGLFCKQHAVTMECVVCPECGGDQKDQGRGVHCEECGYAPMPWYDGEGELKNGLVN